ncbi:hypothetical protein L9F63_019970, partial [Diploptera punctata]
LQFMKLNEFVQETHLDLIVTLNIRNKRGRKWRPKNSLELINFTNKMGYNISWQLGY